MQELEISAPGQVQAREIGIVTAEIRELCNQARATAVAYIVEIGRRLYEAKGMLSHGEWGEWLKNEVDFSHSTANNYMRLFDEYGANQMTIFGAVANSQTIGNLPYSKALALLAVPASERENFAEEVKADELSVKELEKAIKERDEERKRNKALQLKLTNAENARADAERAKKAADAEILSLKNKAKLSDADVNAFKVMFEGLQDQLKKCRNQIAKIRQTNPEAADKLSGAIRALGKDMCENG